MYLLVNHDVIESSTMPYLCRILRFYLQLKWHVRSDCQMRIFVLQDSI